jgi:hypothetical protein
VADLSNQDIILPQGGMYLSGPQGAVPAGRARFMVDVLVDRPGEIRARGPFTPATGWLVPDAEPNLIAAVKNPQGVQRVLLQQMDGKLQIADASGTLQQLYTSGTATNATMQATRFFWDVKPNLAGGVFITHMDYTASARKYSRYEYRGGTAFDTGPGGAGKRLTNLPSGTADTVTFAGGTALTSAHIGCMLYAGPAAGQLRPVGWIYDVPTATTARILTPYYLADGAAGLTWLYAIMPFHNAVPHIVGQGTVTTVSGSAVVTGSNTKFVAGEVAAPSYLYRERDGALIGTVLSIQNDTALTLTVNAFQVVTNEPYYIVKNLNTETGIVGYLSNGTTINTEVSTFRHLPGAWTDTWAGRQWDANRPHPSGGRIDLNTVWYSDKNRMHVVDRVQGSGSYVVVGDAESMSDEIVNIVGTSGGLVIMKRRATFLIPQRDRPFIPQLLVGDGMLNPNSYVKYRDGVVWAGFEGVWYFDGNSVENLVADSLGAEYTRQINALLQNVSNYVSSSSASPVLMTHGDHVWINLKALAVNSRVFIRRP